MQSLYEIRSLDKNNKKMIGDDMVLSYKGLTKQQRNLDEM